MQLSQTVQDGTVAVRFLPGEQRIEDPNEFIVLHDVGYSGL